MITFLSKFFIKEKEDKGKIRQEYGILCGMVGIFLNILLFCGKFFAGTISHSIAVTADAFNMPVAALHSTTCQMQDLPLLR